MSDPKCSNGCIGECCRRFPLSSTYDDLLRNYLDWLNQKPDVRYMEDIHLILPMIRKIGSDPEIPRLAGHEDDPREIFTCIHWNSTTRLCSIYDIRPSMCRTYPNGQKCPHPGCNYGSGENVQQNPADDGKMPQKKADDCV